MNILNFEFKAKTNNLTELENNLLKLNPEFIGEDHQIDTYFNVSPGRLKLRQGNLENSLIHYERANPAPTNDAQSMPEGKLEGTSFEATGKTDPSKRDVLTGTQNLPDGHTKITWKLRLVKPKGKS